ncbi:MAG TPA: hypothetical protein H9700_00275 [Candidatus Eisenbergiella intestinipullorum]|nr:hypothetical protein [Candidatus Eisenbergiella intestinipullorum]
MAKYGNPSSFFTKEKKPAMLESRVKAKRTGKERGLHCMTTDVYSA